MDIDQLGRIKVCCRIRPLGTPDAITDGARKGPRESTPIEVEDRRVHVKSESTEQIGQANCSSTGGLPSGARGGQRRDRWGFTFDDVLEDGCRQEEVYYRCAKCIVDSVLTGLNGTVIACKHAFAVCRYFVNI